MKQQPVPEGTHLLAPTEGGMPGARSKFSKPPAAPTPEFTAKAAAARDQRKSWERTPEGQARTEDISTHFANKTTAAIQSGELHPSGNVTKGSKIPTGMIYELTGRPSTGIGPGMHDQQLPGLSDPSAAPRPPRWEELPATARTHTERALGAHGTSVKQMSKDFGAQHDQGHIRAMSHGANLPYATNFYTSGEPRKVIDESAKQLGIPQPVHAAMNAITSPNTKFSQTGASGETVYPNNEAAMHAVRHVQENGSAEGITNAKGIDPSKGWAVEKYQGYTTNIRKAAMGAEQHFAGKPMEDWRGPSSQSRPEGKGMLGPKTGPYANSWSDTHPQFFVADVHSGGGGMLPHLGSDKPILRDAAGEERINSATGNPRRDKSEREKAVASTPYFHSAADFAARQAMSSRGLTSLRDAQATQWGEEQLSRNIRSSGTTEASVYTKRTAPIRQHERLPGI